MAALHLIDIEASSLSDRSYPIEVGYQIDGEAPVACLVNPELCEDWDDWDAQSEQIHGIPRERLAREGRDPLLVARALNRALSGLTVYSDARDYDHFWLERLFEQTPYTMDFEVGCLRQYIKRAGGAQALALFEAMEAGDDRRHRAAEDVIDIRALTRAVLAGE
ncbi:hypothetical protein J2T57_001295 [Natronocella acetinitrilica]|uniref:Exonuclease domain-containing protein n=1 Tax=Natronocella acetinitrilica TaxID=414046 RepID=A0AAE3KBW5_9GAMM|nr:hypothetical protein [Natronocella acetinitrilica]MCP1674193.1 hypothetical protein [Natronocella acetinitrilica]